MPFWRGSLPSPGSDRRFPHLRLAASALAALSLLAAPVTVNAAPPVLSTLEVTGVRTLTLTFDQNVVMPSSSSRCNRSYPFLTSGFYWIQTYLRNMHPHRVSVSGRTVTLVYHPTVEALPGRPISLSYLAGAANVCEVSLQSNSGEKVASFNRTVTRPLPSGDDGSSGGGDLSSGDAPVASAGADVEVDPGASVTLDGSGSTDPDGDALAYAWERASGAAVTLSGADTAQAAFTAPVEPGELVFRLTVTDPGGLTGSDEVTVTVRDIAPSFGDASVSALELAPGEALAAVVLPAATGGNGALAYSLASDPAGLAGLGFDAATRTLSGTPTAGGSLTFTYTAHDADANRADADAAVLTFAVTVPDRAPSFGDASVSALELAPGEAMAAVVLPAATGGNGALAYSLASDPAGLAGLGFDAATRTLSGTPTAGGSLTFTYTAHDADANRAASDAAVLTFAVLTGSGRGARGDGARPGGHTFGDGVGVGAGAPWLRAEAMAAVVLPAATGGNGALAYSLASDPAGLAGLGFDAATRTLSGTPTAGGSLTFTYTAHDADANRADADAAVLTFAVTVADTRTALVKRTVTRTLVAVARRALTSALDNIGARFAASMPASGLTLAGETVPLGMSGAGAGPVGTGDACGAEASGLHGFGDTFRQASFAAARDGCVPGGRSRTVEASALFHASAFSLALGAAEAEPGFASRAARWAVWGRGDLGTFAGRPDGMRYEGELRTGWLGIDARGAAWVAGLAVSHGTGEADYGFDGSGASGKGRLETALTALYPYGRWTVSEGLELRGVLGAGWGEARHRVDGGPRETGDLAMRMASVGLRYELPALVGVDLAAQADASFARMETGEGPDTVDGLTADSSRLRAGLEASRRLALDEGSALTPFVAAAARRDGGDGLTGTGLELAGGLRYEAPRLWVEARGRWLAAHTEEGAEERGVSVTARVGPGARGRGLWLMLNPRWGAGGVEALWRDQLPAVDGASGRDAAAFDARIGYGVGVAPYGLLTPFAETGLSGEGDSPRLRLGTRFEASPMLLGVELAGEHREGGAAGPEQALRLDLRLRF